MPNGLFGSVNQSERTARYQALEARYPQLPEGFLTRAWSTSNPLADIELWHLARGWDHALNFAGIEQGHNIPRGLLMAVMVQESRGNPLVVSPSGCIGLFQFQANTGRAYGVTDRRDPAQSANGAAAYLRDIAEALDVFNRERAEQGQHHLTFGTAGDYTIIDGRGNIRPEAIPAIVASYNMGPGAIRQLIRQYGNHWQEHLPHDGHGRPGETAVYAENVGAYYTVIAGTAKPEVGVRRANGIDFSSVVSRAHRWALNLYNAVTQRDESPSPAAENPLVARARELETQFASQGNDDVNDAIRHDRDIVMAIQTQLKSLGLYDGAVDGLYGRGTLAAWARFEQQNAGRNGVVNDRYHHISATEVAAILSAPAPITPTMTAGRDFTPRKNA